MYALTRQRPITSSRFSFAILDPGKFPSTHDPKSAYIHADVIECHGGHYVFGSYDDGEDEGD